MDGPRVGCGGLCAADRAIEGLVGVEETGRRKRNTQRCRKNERKRMDASAGVHGGTGGQPCQPPAIPACLTEPKPRADATPGGSKPPSWLAAAQEVLPAAGSACPGRCSRDSGRSLGILRSVGAHATGAQRLESTKRPSQRRGLPVQPTTWQHSRRQLAPAHSSFLSELLSAGLAGVWRGILVTICAGMGEGGGGGQQVGSRLALKCSCG